MRAEKHGGGFVNGTKHIQMFSGKFYKDVSLDLTVNLGSVTDKNVYCRCQIFYFKSNCCVFLYFTDEVREKIVKLSFLGPRNKGRATRSVLNDPFSFLTDFCTFESLGQFKYI